MTKKTKNNLTVLNKTDLLNEAQLNNLKTNKNIIFVSAKNKSGFPTLLKHINQKLDLKTQNKSEHQITSLRQEQSLKKIQKEFLALNFDLDRYNYLNSSVIELKTELEKEKIYLEQAEIRISENNNKLKFSEQEKVNIETEIKTINDSINFTNSEIAFSGIPHNPKPPSIKVIPLLTPRKASSTLFTFLSK